MRNPIDMLIGIILFGAPEVAEYFWPVVSFVLAFVLVITWLLR